MSFPPRDEDFERKLKWELRQLDEVVSDLRQAVEDDDVYLPPRALPIIQGVTETLHALNFGGWPWTDPILIAISRQQAERDTD